MKKMMNHKLTSVVTGTLIAASLISGCIHANQTEKEKPMPPSISMAAPTSDSGNIYARGMSAILSYLGTELSYDQVMGLSGVAFILQVDTSGPYLPGNELDCAWWPNDDWGFELGLPVLTKASGWEISKLSADSDAYKANPEAEFRRIFLSAIEKSLRAGKPVLSYGFVCIATDEQQPPLLGYGTKGHSTQYGQSKTRIQSYPWNLYVIGNKTSAGSPTDVDLASLRHIIALFNEQAQGANAPKTRFSGKQAWAEWLRLLRAGSACDNNMLIHLRYNRRSAVAYLREMAKRHTGVTAKHISSAADLYQSIVDEATKEGLPYNRVKSGEDEKTVRSGYTAMVERVSKLEAQAIAELKAAAASITGTP
ncbi:MAG: hypothetical protein KAR11_01640 [Phycisphaerae bacterium]|nr:hypothetical protein [Phycisphaerae bacterium]